MSFVKCDLCNTPIDNWSGNVMIPKNSTEGTIDDLQIWCKPCTRKMDSAGPGMNYHNLWELNWIREDREDILKESDYAERFSGKVREKVINIINTH